MFRLMFRRTLSITVAWIAVSMVVSVYDHLTFLVFAEHASTYAFRPALLSNMVGGLLGGIFGATLIVFYLKRTASQRSFPVAVMVHTVGASGAILLVIFLVANVFQAAELGLVPSDPEVLRSSFGFLVSPAAGKLLLFWFVVVGLTSILLEVSDKYGPSVLRAFVLGRYHRPKVEQRCFMFLDMRSSTAIAESVGHQRYFDLLRSCFRDMTAPIIETSGEIYQYVGDEVVLTWPLASGVADGNCVRCFHLIREALSDRAAAYTERFGVVPEFKAGLHAGEVTTGEVGTLRKDIVFTGDVLNTTARIQERCNALGDDLLVSEALLERLPESARGDARRLERVTLRGQDRPVTLYGLAERTDL